MAEHNRNFGLWTSGIHYCKCGCGEITARNFKYRLGHSGHGGPSKSSIPWNKGKKSELKQIKEQIRKRDKYMCKSCEKKQIDQILEMYMRNKLVCILPVHHIDHNKRNNLEINLITLCSSCHMKIHRN